MQLTQDTADSLEADPKDAEESVIAGAKYLRSLYDRLPDGIAEPDRTWFALAAYNIGMGHVYDARALARKQGANPDHWVETRRYIGLLDSPKWYARTKHGKARGDEAVRHVYRIRRLYSLIQGYEQRARTAYAKAADGRPEFVDEKRAPTAWQRLFVLDTNPETASNQD
jgi:membrane-bound lytic murein transglycosylase F